eukprot:880254-Pyramimonas_sp.AAC.1
MTQGIRKHRNIAKCRIDVVLLTNLEHFNFVAGLADFGGNHQEGHVCDNRVRAYESQCPSHPQECQDWNELQICAGAFETNASLIRGDIVIASDKKGNVCPSTCSCRMPRVPISR